MDVALGVHRSFHLNDQVYIWNINSSGCNICGDQHIGSSLSESSESLFSGLLSDVTMYDINTLLDFFSMRKLIGFSLRLGKHNRFAISTINKKNVRKCLQFVGPWTSNAKMFNVLLSLILSILCQVNQFMIRSQVVLGYFLDPWRHSC